jgi:hypothetical protein
MDRTTELALLASHVYGTLTAVQSTENTVPLPENWQVVAIGGAPFRINADSGFMARTYRNSVTNEVVISYAGTTYEKERQLADDCAICLARSASCPQMLDVVSYYLAAHKELEMQISFTGHSWVVSCFMAGPLIGATILIQRRFEGVRTRNLSIASLDRIAFFLATL